MSRATALVLVLFATALSTHAIELPRPNEKWITLRIDEFTLVSNVSAAETSEIARDLVRMRQAIGEITQLRVRSSKPTRVVIFATDRGFAPYRQAVLNQTNEQISGAFVTTDGGNFILMKRGNAAEDIDRTVYHELTHYFVRNTMTGLPLWTSEGIAEYYSTFRTYGDAVHIGRPVVQHVQWLRQETMIPLRELFATTVDSPVYNEGSRAGIFYAQSWALFHYLMADDARRAQFGEFLRLLAQDKPVDTAFATAFAKSYADLETHLRAYVRKQAFTFTKYTLAPSALPPIPKPEPMSRDALLFELGHLLVHAAPQATADARRFLDAALAVNASHAGAHADIGRLLHFSGQRQEASASFARAAELGSSDPQVHLLIGMSTLDAVEEGERSVGPPDEAMLKARKAFQRSAELDPSSALAWNGIGATYILTNENPAAGIEALEKSLTLAPGDVSAAFNLVQLYARAGRRAEAQKLIDTVLSRGADKQMLAFARESVRRSAMNASIAKINEAISHANTGDVKKALAILDGTLPEITDPEMLRKATALRADLATRVKEK